MNEFVRILITRLYSPWSTDTSQQLALYTEILHNIDQSIDDFRYTQEGSSSKPSVSVTQSNRWITFLQLVFDEIFRGPELIGYIRYLADAITPQGKLIITSKAAPEISSICTSIIEPICQRFSSTAEKSKVPCSLKTIIAACCSSKSKNSTLQILAESLIPKIVQCVFGSTLKEVFKVTNPSASSLAFEDRAMLSDLIQELLKLCFGKSTLKHNQNDHTITLSLSHSALLSRSKWHITRYVLVHLFILICL